MASKDRHLWNCFVNSICFKHSFQWATSVYWSVHEYIYFLMSVLSPKCCVTKIEQTMLLLQVVILCQGEQEAESWQTIEHVASSNQGSIMLYSLLPERAKQKNSPYLLIFVSIMFSLNLQEFQIMYPDHTLVPGLPCPFSYPYDLLHQ